MTDTTAASERPGRDCSARSCVSVWGADVHPPGTEFAPSEFREGGFMRLASLLITVLIAAAVVYEKFPLLWVIVAAFVAVCAALPLGIHALCYARRRVVTCPGSGGPAEIEVQASGNSGAGFTVTNCSLWYKASGCNRSCVR